MQGLNADIILIQEGWDLTTDPDLSISTDFVTISGTDRNGVLAFVRRRWWNPDCSVIACNKHFQVLRLVYQAVSLIVVNVHLPPVSRGAAAVEESRFSMALGDLSSCLSDAWLKYQCWSHIVVAGNLNTVTPSGGSFGPYGKGKWDYRVKEVDKFARELSLSWDNTYHINRPTHFNKQTNRVSTLDYFLSNSTVGNTSSACCELYEEDIF